jgi:hypothetical protein
MGVDAGGGNACASLSASAVIGDNSCNGNGAAVAACVGRVLLVGNNSCNGNSGSIAACSRFQPESTIGDKSCNGNGGALAACASGPGVVANNSCNGDGTSFGACANTGGFAGFAGADIGAGSCNGTGHVFAACAESPQLVSVGDNSCNGDSDSRGNTPCSVSGAVSVVTVGNNSCDGPGACIELDASVGDCQGNTVLVPVCAVADLQNQVVGVGPGKSLANKLTLVHGDLAIKDNADACTTLTGFINEVNAQSARIGTTLAASLITQARAIQTAIGC